MPNRRHDFEPLSLRRTADLSVSSFDERDNSIEVCFTTGAAVMRRGPQGPYWEILSTDPAAVRLDRLNAGAALLNTHADFRIENVLGAVVAGTALMVGGKGLARVKLSQAAGDADAVQKIRTGIIRSVSVGYVVHAATRSETDQASIPTVVATDWEPYEISIVPIPADPGAQVRSLQTRSEVSPMPARIPGEPLRHRSQAIAGAILARFDERKFPLSPDSREFVGQNAIGMARAALEAGGVSTRGLSTSEILDRAMTTSDFPNILADVASKSLRRAYAAAPATWKPIVRQLKLRDFRAHTLAQFGEAPQLEPVNEKGEYKSGSLADGAERIKLATYGKMVRLTRQAIINDDLGAITRIPDQFGQSAANLESDLVWGIVTANGAMADGKALFHADHGNLAAAGGVPTVTTVSAGRTAMAQQKGLDGKTPLSIAAGYIIVPSALATPAEQLVGATFPVETGGVVPPTLRRLQVISEPRLDVNSPARWYLSADPEQIDTLVAATLEGSDSANIETRWLFEVDGMDVKCRHDFAAAAADFRGLYANPGA